MYCLTRDLSDQESVLAEFAFSDFDQRHIGRRSAPWTIHVEAGALEKVAYAAWCTAPWNTRAEAQSDGRVSKRIATLAYFWHLINNTPTYRAYETFVQAGLAENVAHLHTGDEYRYFHPIYEGDQITVDVELSSYRDHVGRRGPMKFIEDIWSFRNQHNVLVAQLVRKVVTVYYERDEAPVERAPAPRLSDMVPDDAVVTIPNQPFSTPTAVDVFGEARVGYRHEIGPVTWTMMVQWMGAVDDYARTHYDWDYARERGFPGGKPIVAGPHMGALMVAPVQALIGRGAWIENFDHIQRHPVNPNDRLKSFGVTSPSPDGDPDKRHVEAWLVDEEDRVVNWATFDLRKWPDAPRGELSETWKPVKLGDA